MAINSAIYYIDTSVDGLVVDKTFTLSGEIIPVLYETVNGPKDYVSWGDSRVLALRQMSEILFRSEFISPFKGYLQLWAIDLSLLTEEEVIQDMQKTVTMNSVAITDRVDIESWKRMNNYFESELQRQQKEMNELRTTLDVIQGQIKLVSSS